MPSPDGRPCDDVLAEALTCRQQAIVVLITAGLTNQEIADRLSLERSLIAQCVDQIVRRLGLTPRGQVALWAVCQGLVPSNSAVC